MTLRIDARVVYCLTVKTVKSMATIAIEFGKETSKKTRKVYLRVNQGKTAKRIKTGVVLSESEFTPKTKKIKCLEKAQLIEKLKKELLENINALETGATTKSSADAKTVAARISRKQKENELEFFAFVEKWLESAKIKGAKNYRCMLNTLEAFLGSRNLIFPEITVRFLKDFEAYLDNRPRAQSLYLGQMRHVYREAMLEYNTDESVVIKDDPFMRYRTPKQVLKKGGARALSLEDFLKIANFKASKGGRAELAHDCFLLSFCLMGMNSADFYNAEKLVKNTICYNRTKTKDRRNDDAYIEVMIHPFIKRMAEKWRDVTGKRVFNFYKRFADEKGLNRAINIGLKEIGRAVKIDNLEFYQARHTFATLSRNLMKFSKSDVDEALNHVGSYGIADVYISKDFTIINENNFKLIDTVFGLKKEAPTDKKTKSTTGQNQVKPV